MYKVRKIRNQPHFGIYKNGKLHSRHPTKRLAKKMMGGMVEPEPRYIEPIIISPRRIPSHAVSTIDEAEEAPIEPITEEANDPTFADTKHEYGDYPTVKDVLETVEYMRTHYNSDKFRVPLDLHHIQTLDIPAGTHLSEYIPTTQIDLERMRERLSEKFAEYLNSISHLSDRDYDRKFNVANEINQRSFMEIQEMENELREKELLDEQQTVSKVGNQPLVSDLEYLPWYYPGRFDIPEDESEIQHQMIKSGYTLLDDPQFNEYLMRREQKQNYGRYDPSRPYLIQRRELAPNDDGYLYPVNPYLYSYGDIYRGMTLKGLQKLYYDYLRDRTIAFNDKYPTSTTPYHTRSAQKVVDRNKQLYQKSISPLNSIATDLYTKKNEDALQKAKYRVYLSKNKEQQKSYVKAHKEEFEEKAQPHLERRKGNPELREKQRRERHEKEEKKRRERYEKEESKESEPPDDTLQRYHPRVPRVPKRIYDEAVYRPEPKPEPKPESKPKPRPKPKLITKGTPI